MRKSVQPHSIKMQKAEVFRSASCQMVRRRGKWLEYLRLSKHTPTELELRTNSIHSGAFEPLAEAGLRTKARSVGVLRLSHLGKSSSSSSSSYRWQTFILSYLLYHLLLFLSPLGTRNQVSSSLEARKTYDASISSHQVCAHTRAVIGTMRADSCSDSDA